MYQFQCSIYSPT